jgi:hypothetical protein
MKKTTSHFQAQQFTHISNVSKGDTELIHHQLCLHQSIICWRILLQSNLPSWRGLCNYDVGQIHLKTWVICKRHFVAVGILVQSAIVQAENGIP